MYILGIESSCDETSVAIVKDGTKEISTVISSQIDTHKEYGGVIPEIASRMHIENITLVIDKCLKDAKLTMKEIDAIAITYGPGLIGSLLVGLEAAKTLSFIHNKPLIKVHHIIGHIYSNYLKKPFEFPLIALVVSGGHTDLIYMDKNYSFKTLGSTLDDAIGEAYDKVSRVIGIPYPGGPLLDKLAKNGEDTYKLPIPLDDDTYNFSFSGIKSAVINLVHNEKQKGNLINKENLAKSFQNRVIHILVKKTFKALNEYNVKNLIIAGGVASNSELRKQITEMALKNNINFNMPDVKYCTDNAAMIASAGYFAYQNNLIADMKLSAVSVEKL